MYYRFSTFYRRDVSFVYEQKSNKIEWLDLFAGIHLNTESTLLYMVDKIDSYIDKYDVLPTIGLPLISKKWEKTFSDLVGKDFQLLNTIIRDKKGNENRDFFALNILHVLPCLDKTKSIFDIDEDGDYDIRKFYISPNALQKHSIIRMEEHSSYIIVTEEFKKQCDENHLKGILFIEEGYSIYNY